MKQHRKLISCSAVAACLLAAGCGGDHPTAIPAASDTQAVAVPAVIPVDIVNAYPHDPAAFTEGLEYKDGMLYESVGNYGHSDVRTTDLKTGKIIASTRMDAKYFGEGLTLLNGHIYQLTYREGRGFIYDAATLKQTGTFGFTAPEGWGMTNNGSALIYNDGTNVFHYIDPVSYKEIKTLKVTDDHGPVNQLNEPEMIHGYLYANQWQTDYILKIDTATGKVVGRADLGSLRQQAGIPAPSGRRNAPDVLNGIAYDAGTNRIFVTGKNWPKLFEIRLDN